MRWHDFIDEPFLVVNQSQSLFCRAPIRKWEDAIAIAATAAAAVYFVVSVRIRISR